jgi:hypothetical protein
MYIFIKFSRPKENTMEWNKQANEKALPVCPYVSIVFVCSLFNDAVSNSYYTASNSRMKVNNELERMWKETAVP